MWAALILFAVGGFMLGYYSGKYDGHKQGYVKGYWHGRNEERRNRQQPCECNDCFVGIRYYHELTDLITMDEYDSLAKEVNINPNVYDDVKKFNYCPHCGRKIAW